MTKGLGVDATLIRKLAAMLRDNGLGEIEYQEGDRRIRVAMPRTTLAASAPAAHAAPLPAPVAATGGIPEGAVTSPMVGTAYLSPEPGSASFVKVGDRVKEGQTLLIIEAMKVMNPVRSPRAGIVQQVIVANGSPVEYGEPLMTIA
jgi:acetyl-CoA carboxylase biotin carboxyl carrier protein